MWLVVDNSWNRTNYPNLIGKTFETAPSYARVIWTPESKT